MKRNWIGVASADHVRHGLAAGIMQLCHGKASPLRRVLPGDLIAYYSPTVEFRGTEKCRAFTAFGVARDGAPYRFEMSEDFCPYRRDVEWLPARDAPIAPLLERLDFAAGRRNWGYQLRFGIFAASDHDMQIIAEAMGVKLARVSDAALACP